ncbi:MAG: porin, partial [Bacteroidaceae bacterium]|nr:porin [Bacteroidaceae bacterium]
MKIQRILLLALLAGMASTASAQFQKSILKEFQQNSKFGGYIIGKYDYNDKEGTQTNGGFDLRLGRVYVDGKVQDFNYKLQVEVSGTPNTANTTEKIARIVDAYAEWEKYPFAKIKFGQFKRAFTFENPYNPFDVGFNNYAQVVSKLSGMADRNGEHSSGGRDLGIQLQGDFAKMSDGHNLIHYQVMVANGQGINHSDV